MGINTDIQPYELPLNMWSAGNNVRFEDGAVMRSNVFRVLEDTMTPTIPVFLYGARPATGGDYLLYVGDDGSMYKWASGTETDVTNAAFTPAVLSSPYTACRSGELHYFSRKGVIPYYYGPATAKFTTLTGWDAGWSCKSLREHKDHLIALNMTIGGVEYPNMVKTSDTITSDAPPGSWDHTDLSTNAIERQLAGLPDIIDGLTLGNAFMLYGETGVWRMTLVGGKYIWQTVPAFKGPGLINQNCIIDQGGYHYVFGNNDIYRHDGSRWESIADSRVRKFIYDNLDLTDAPKFFVCHEPEHSEIKFCYISSDEQASNQLHGVVGGHGQYCNRFAMFNYIHNTWSFGDLPNVSSWGMANVNESLTYANAAQTYDEIGGSYFDQENAANLNLCMTSVAEDHWGLTVSKLLGLDLADQGTLSYPLDSEAAYEAWVERVGLDLDELGLPSRTMKVISNIEPKVRTFLGNTINVEVGAHNIAELDPTWLPSQTYDPATEYKLDFMIAGRYLAVRFTQPAQADFQFAQYDLAVSIAGHR
jgi:hypothetical protein